MKKISLFAALSLAYCTSAMAISSAADVNLSSRQSGFTGVLSQLYSDTGALSNGPSTLYAGPVVQTEKQVSSLGQGSYQIPATVSLIPSYNWNQDLNGDGQVSEQEILTTAQANVDANIATFTTNMAALLQQYGLQSGWYTWSEKVKPSGSTTDKTVYWTALVIPSKTGAPKVQYGQVKLADGNPVVLEMEVYSQDMDPSLAYFAPQLANYNWGGSKAGSNQYASGGTAGTLKWRAARVDGTPVNPSAQGAWNIVSIGNSLDRSLNPTTVTGTNPSDPSGVYDPVQCVVSTSNPGCATKTNPTYETLSAQTGAQTGLIYYQEKVAPPLDIYQGADVPHLEFEFNKRAVDSPDICSSGTFTTAGCFDTTLQYQTSAYSVDQNTLTATFIGSATGSKALEDDTANCTKGQMFTPVSTAVTADQANFPWYLNFYRMGQATKGPYDQWAAGMRDVAPKTNRGDFPLEHISLGDVSVLNNIVNDQPVTTDNSQYRGAQSLGPEVNYGNNTVAYNIAIPQPACAECVPQIQDAIREFCTLGNCKNIWLNEACPAKENVCTSYSKDCQTVNGVTTCAAKCDTFAMVTPCWNHGWNTNSCKLNGSTNVTSSTENLAGRDAAQCPAGFTGTAFTPWTQTNIYHSDGTAEIGQKVYGTTDVSGCIAPMSTSCTAPVNTTNTGADMVTCPNGTTAMQPWTQTVSTYTCTNSGSDPASCPANSTGTASTPWTQDYTYSSTGAKQYTQTYDQVCQVTTTMSCNNSTTTGTDTITCPNGSTAQQPWTQTTQTCTTTTSGTTQSACPSGTTGSVSTPYQQITSTSTPGAKTYTQTAQQVCTASSAPYIAQASVNPSEWGNAIAQGDGMFFTSSWYINASGAFDYIIRSYALNSQGLYQVADTLDVGQMTGTGSYGQASSTAKFAGYGNALSYDSGLLAVGAISYTKPGVVFNGGAQSSNGRVDFISVDPATGKLTPQSSYVGALTSAEYKVGGSVVVTNGAVIVSSNENISGANYGDALVFDRSNLSATPSKVTLNPALVDVKLIKLAGDKFAGLYNIPGSNSLTEHFFTANTKAGGNGKTLNVLDERTRTYPSGSAGAGESVALTDDQNNSVAMTVADTRLLNASPDGKSLILGNVGADKTTSATYYTVYDPVQIDLSSGAMTTNYGTANEWKFGSHDWTRFTFVDNTNVLMKTKPINALSFTGPYLTQGVLMSNYKADSYPRMSLNFGNGVKTSLNQDTSTMSNFAAGLLDTYTTWRLNPVVTNGVNVATFAVTNNQVTSSLKVTSPSDFSDSTF